MAQKVVSLKQQANLRKIGGVAMIVAIVTIVAHHAIISLIQDNYLFWFAVVALVAGLILLEKSDGEYNVWLYYGYVGMYWTLFGLATVAPLVHMSTPEKVWIVGNRTTVNSTALIRSPFSKLAKSIDTNQDVTMYVTSRTKDGAVVTATLSGKFRLLENEEIVLKLSTKAPHPDSEVKADLIGSLNNAFAKAVSSMTVADISTAKNNFAVEHTIATVLQVGDLGLIGNGPIVVSGIHPHFTGK